MRHPIIGIRGSKPRVLPTFRQVLAEEEAQKRKAGKLRKKRKGGVRKGAKAA